MKKYFIAVGALVGAGWIAQAGCVGDTPVVPVDAGTVKSCTKGSECTSGFCSDGVCCDSACDGTCEACNVSGSAGSCVPVPDGQDPANECAGGGDAGGGGDGGAADADLNLPDAGLTLDDTKCGGKCNGKRACALADNTVTCGTVFCNNPSQQGRAACDGTGHCSLALEACTAYSCPDGTGDAGSANGCLTSCTGEADCLPTHYCVAGKCQPKLANGSVCSSVPQCQSGHCVSGVCCNDECQGVGGSCTTSGKVGQCICPACSTGSCKLWYKDNDNDGYGDSTGTLGNSRAAAGCATAPDGGTPSPPQAGFVENNTDCFDALANVHPGQASYFTAPYGPNSSFDYNCDNQTTKQTAEYVGGSCGFCNTLQCTKSTTCLAKSVQSYHGCLNFNKVCSGRYQAAFHTTVACGTTCTLYTCGTCTGPGGTAPYTTGPLVQGCH